MLTQTFILILGLILLVKGADFLLSSSIALGKKFNVSDFFIGLIVVGFGTSLAELLVSIDAVIKNSPDLSVGNIIGSNISNILLVLGVSLAFSNITPKKISKFDINFHLISHLLFLFIISAFIFNTITGILFLLLFAMYVFFSFKNSSIESNEEINLNDFFSRITYQNPIKFGLPIIILSILLTLCGAELTVESALEISALLGIPDSFLGLTVVAIGTSLPEVVTSIRAMQRKNSEIVIGNIIGSNIYNLLLILGFVSLFNSFKFSKELLFFEVNFLVIFVIMFSIFLFFRIDFKKKYSIIFLIFYLIYLLKLYFSNF